MTSGTEQSQGQTVTSTFVDTVAAHGDLVALRWKDGETWHEWTFAEYADKVARAAAGLRRLDVKRGDRVLLMLRNVPEFHVLDVAILMVGATPISIYNSSSSEQIAYLAGHCRAVLAIVEDDSFLARFEPVRDQLPALKSVGVVRPGDRTADFTWDDLLSAEPIDLAEAAAESDPSDLATVIYTSGTTGPPKGVMISHSNVLFAAQASADLMGIEEAAGKRLVSYLPMAHIAERMVSHYQQILLGYEVSCLAEGGKVAQACAEVHPHIFFGVPRVWEKIHAGVVGALAADPAGAKKFEDAVDAARDIALRRSWGTNTTADDTTWEALDRAAFAPMRTKLGVDELLAGVTGAAPITPELLMWFRAIGVPLSEVYGMSENTGLMTWTPEKIKPGMVGPAAPGTEVTTAEDGEVMCRGPHVFQGYLDDPDKTAEALSSDGWLHSGDIGELDDDGYLRIVDRKKELIITAGGKNISPANLEAALKTIPLVGQAAAIGDGRPFVSALVVLDPDAAPGWAAQHGLAGKSLAELAEEPQVIAEIEGALPVVMSGFNGAESVKKVKVLGEEWMPDSEILTPTSKLKRRGIKTAFAKDIEELYA